jgi:drug/metabolite transporter (DMT)-like permease
MTSAAARTDAHHPLRGFLYLILATIFWAGSAVVAKFLFNFEGDKFDTVILSQMRTTLSFAMMTVWFGATRREVFHVRLNDLPLLALIGCVGIGVTNFSYYYTVRASTVATAILIQYTAPAFVTVYGYFIARNERVEGLKLISLAVALAGCYVAVTGFHPGVVQLSAVTIFSGMCSSLGFAFLLIVSKKILVRYSNWTMLIYAFGFTALGWLFFSTPADIVARGYQWQDWETLIFFALISVLVPYALFSLGLKELSPTPVAITMTLEPIVAIVFAAIFLGERLSMIQSLGAVGVVLAVLMLQVDPRRRSRTREVGNAD